MLCLGEIKVGLPVAKKESAGLCGWDGTVTTEEEVEWVPAVQSEEDNAPEHVLLLPGGIQVKECILLSRCPLGPFAAWITVALQQPLPPNQSSPCSEAH